MFFYTNKNEKLKPNLKLNFTNILSCKFNFYNLQSFTVILVIFLVFSSFFNLPITQAGTGNWTGYQFMIVTSLRGLNVRDKIVI